MAKDRSLFRNIHLYVASTGEYLGGILQEGFLTEENLLWMLGQVLLIVDEDWTVRHRASSRIVTSSSNQATTGEYDLYSNGKSSQFPYLKLAS